jgi:ribosomal-protein-alanine N-acetyltransferase
VSITEEVGHSAEAVLAGDGRASVFRRLKHARRTFDHLGWWRLDDWSASPLWTFCDRRAASLIVPLDLSPDAALEGSQSRIAWVRWVGIADGASATPCVQTMFAEAEARLAAQGIRELWCVVRASDWLEPYLSDHAYLVADRLFTYEVRLQARPQTQERRLGDAFIRRAAAEDLTALCALDEMCFEGPWHYPPALMRVMFERAFWMTVAICAGQIIGYACSQIHSWTGHVVRLAVHPEARRHGIGTALLCEQLDRLAQAGARTVSLNTQGGNQVAQRLYQRLGFRRLSEEARVLRKSLDQGT